MPAVRIRTQRLAVALIILLAWAAARVIPASNKQTNHTRPSALPGSVKPPEAPSAGSRDGGTPLSRSAQEARLLGGAWNASGEVVSVQNYANRYRREVFHREWLFRRQCNGGRCAIWFTRTTAEDPLTAPLWWSRGRWVTAESQSVPCPPVESEEDEGVEHASWKFTVTPSAITAVERKHVSREGHCNEAHSVSIWKATRAESAGGASSA